MPISRSVLRPGLLVAAVVVSGLGPAGVAAADPDPNAVPAPLLNTNCTTDQLLGATKVEDRPTYDALNVKYNSQPPWLQRAILTHMDDLLAKDPAGRQAEVDELGGLFPEYAAVLRTQEPEAGAIAAECQKLPAQDPSLLAPLP